jgi:hypothetical protein
LHLPRCSNCLEHSTSFLRWLYSKELKSSENFSEREQP